ncbi:hypothetical protein D3C75_1381320 [compost metagenome]
MLEQEGHSVFTTIHTLEAVSADHLGRGIGCFEALIIRKGFGDLLFLRCAIVNGCQRNG